MARTKISVYVSPDVADTLKRLATVENRSQSDLIDEAIAHCFARTGLEAEHAVVIAPRDVLARRLGQMTRRIVGSRP